MKELTMKMRERLESTLATLDGVTLSTYDGNEFVIVDSWPTLKQVNDLLGADLDDLLEWGFSDEYDTCSNCYKVIRTSPTYYGWQPDYFDFPDGGRLCSGCIKAHAAEEYLEAHVNRRRMVNEYVVDPAEYDWVKLDISYENGMHHGQNDDPDKIVEVLNSAGVDCLFTGSMGQFDVEFYVWVRNGNQEKAMAILDQADVTLGYDQATEIEKALRGEHSDYIKVETYIVKAGDPWPISLK